MGLRTFMVLSLIQVKPSAICRDYMRSTRGYFKNRVRQGANNQITNS